jgi:hypothetical protein
MLPELNKTCLIVADLKIALEIQGYAIMFAVAKNEIIYLFG